MAGGILSVALVFPRLIVRGIPLFKGTPCSMQSGLSSAGKRTAHIAARLTLPAAIARGHMFQIIIYILRQNMQVLRKLFLSDNADTIQKCENNQNRSDPADRQRPEHSRREKGLLRKLLAVESA